MPVLSVSQLFITSSTTVDRVISLIFYCLIKMKLNSCSALFHEVVYSHCCRVVNHLNVVILKDIRGRLLPKIVNIWTPLLEDIGNYKACAVAR